MLLPAVLIATRPAAAAVWIEDFSDLSGWTVVTPGSGTMTVRGGVLTMSSGGTYDLAYANALQDTGSFREKGSSSPNLGHHAAPEKKLLVVSTPTILSRLA